MISTHDMRLLHLQPQAAIHCRLQQNILNVPQAFLGRGVSTLSCPLSTQPTPYSNSCGVGLGFQPLTILSFGGPLCISSEKDVITMWILLQVQQGQTPSEHARCSTSNVPIRRYCFKLHNAFPFSPPRPQSVHPGLPSGLLPRTSSPPWNHGPRRLAGTTYAAYS